MNPINPTHFILPISIIWWTLYFARIRRFVQKRTFFTMPNLYLWLNLYAVGFIYYLHNYDLEQRLQAQVAFTGLPLASLLKALLSTGFVTYGYILIVRRYTRLTVTRKIDGLIIVALLTVAVINFGLYNHIPYLKLQIITNTILSMANLSAAVSLIPMTRTLLKSQKTQVREAHHLWFVTFLGASSFAVMLFLADCINKLITHSTVINSPLFVAAEVSVSVYMVALEFLFGPDRYLYWIYYPARLFTYRKLKRLADRIQQEAGVEAVYHIPLPRVPTLAVMELAIYRLFIVILDSYTDLNPETELHERLRQIDQRNAPYQETIRQLMEIA